MADPSQKHVDDRLDAIRGRCEAIRSHAMAAARDADNIRSPELHWRFMELADAAEKASEKADEKALVQRLSWQAMNEDIMRERQAEARREQIALVDERYEARKVGREEL